MEIHRSAHKHKVADDDIEHAVVHALVIADLDPEADPPRVLAIGPNRVGNLLEIIWLDLPGSHLVIHAMPIRRVFYDLLPTEGDS